MRLTTGLVIAGFSSLATASSAAIYEIKNRPNSLAKSIVSLDDARLSLAHLLGTTENYHLGARTLEDPKIQLLNSLGSSEDLFHEEKGRLILSLSGVGLEDIDALALGEPVMALKELPSTTSTGQLAKSLALEKASIVGGNSHEIYSLDSSFCIATADVRDAESKVSAYKFANYKSWQAGDENKGVTKEMAQVYNPDRNEDRHFVSEYLLFKGFVERVLPQLKEEGATAFCHSQAMEGLISAYGQDSTEVNLALTLYRTALKSPAFTDAIVLVTPPTSTNAVSWPHQQQFHKRYIREAPLSMEAEFPESTLPPAEAATKPKTSPAKPHTPLGSNAFIRCHPDEDACTSGTNSCSGHGTCTKSSKGCWACVCKPDVIKKDGSNSTTVWAGMACSKQDISVPFNIFFLFTIAMVVVITWAIGLMISIGNEPLPSVLSAGVAPTKRT